MARRGRICRVDDTKNFSGGSFRFFPGDTISTDGSLIAFAKRSLLTDFGLSEERVLFEVVVASEAGERQFEYLIDSTPTFSDVGQFGFDVDIRLNGELILSEFREDALDPLFGGISLSDDGQSIAFSIDGTLSRGDVDQDTSLDIIAENSADPVLSANGRFLAFVSADNNLSDADDNGVSDIYIQDGNTGLITLVSSTVDGVVGDAASFDPDISNNGRWVVFASDAENLVDDDTNNATDIFVKDLSDGSITRVSTTNDGAQADGTSTNAKIAGFGRYVVFESDAPNLVPDDTNNQKDVFIKDLRTGLIELVSVGAEGEQGNGDSSNATVSDDGRIVGFLSDADNLVTQDGPIFIDAFLKNTQTDELLPAQSISSNRFSSEAILIANVEDITISGDGNRLFLYELTPGYQLSGPPSRDLVDELTENSLTNPTSIGTVDSGISARDADFDVNYVALTEIPSPVVIGTPEGERLFGTGAAEYFVADDGSDDELGNGGNDVFLMGPGRDFIGGGGGRDTALFDGLIEDFAGLTFDGDSTYVVIDENPSDGDSGRDRLSGVETFEFRNALFDAATSEVTLKATGSLSYIPEVAIPDRVAFGTDANNRLEGSQVAEFFDAGGGRDDELGNGGDDVFLMGPGRDFIGGGGGSDTALFDGLIDDFDGLIFDGDTTYIVIDTNPADGDSGRDRISGVETFEFKDALFDATTGNVTFKATPAVAALPTAGASFASDLDLIANATQSATA